MTNMMNVYGIMSGLATQWLDKQEPGPKDYVDAEGYLVCGVCGERRQKIIILPAPTEDNPNQELPLKVTCMCKCERDREDEEKRCKAEKKNMERIASLRSASLMDDRFREATFKQFEKKAFNERNLKLCQRYSEKFNLMMEKNQGLLFWGSVGTGKTFAAACIANALLERKIPVMMTSFVKLIALIESGRERDSSILERIGKAKLVIFDDLGAERNTAYALEKVYGIVDARYRQKLPMIFTTNLTPDEMKKEQDERYARIYDRIFGNCYPMQFVGPSWRRKEAGERFMEMEKLLLGDGEEI